LRLLAPIAPHVTHYLWRELGFGEDILDAGWPQLDEEALRQDSLEYVIQVNGKVRGRVTVPTAADQSMVQAAALANEQIAKFIAGKPIRKAILVPGKLLNLVV
jgi:leucyl-tRNA synthetase (EC 6.1.1.4)